MRGNLAEEVTYGLSWPSKMACPAWGISATRCRIGSVLAKQENTVCRSCYVMNGTFRSGNVEKIMQRAYDGMFDPRWTPAMYALVRLHAKDRFRWFHSGDVHSKCHFPRIMRICTELRDVLFWMPTREAAVVKACQDAIPDNARAALREPDRRAGTEVVEARVHRVSDPNEATCPSSLKSGNCGTHTCTDLPPGTRRG